jgi:membrane fusion protein
MAPMTNPYEPAKATLFREQAINARRDKFNGQIILSYPLPAWIASAFGIITAAMIVIYVGVGTYTKKVLVSGQVVPRAGLVRVYAPQFGTIKARSVAEGSQVPAGTPLFVLSSDRSSMLLGNTQDEVSRQIILRIESLEVERMKTLAMQKEERESMQAKIASLRGQVDALSTQFDEQKRRVSLADDAAKRYGELLSGSYISVDQFQQKVADSLDQSARLNQIQRERMNTMLDLKTARGDFAGLPLKQANQIAQVDRLKSQASQELVESESKREIVIKSPVAGTVTSIVAEIGQIVDTSHPLLGLVPRNSALRVDLYAPSEAIGFIRQGDKVLIHYKSYPYQKFGQYPGTVDYVSRTPMAAAELSAINGGIPGVEPGKEAQLYYRISVSPDREVVNAYGREISLMNGMTVEANVLQETRRLYEWILEPLISLRGSVI